MAIIYALQGKQKIGKSQTVVQLFLSLRDKYVPPALIQDWSVPCSYTFIMTNVNGKTVGIESRGETADRLEQAITNFINAGCDIIFCSCRRTGETVECLNNFIEHTVKYIQQDIAPPDQQEDRNLKTAQRLIELAGL
jgi:hypothetical protein